MGNPKRERTLQTRIVAFNKCCEEEKEEGAVLGEEEGEKQGLIPGLPDDVAMECLVRVPSGSHRRMRHVCRRWRRVVGSLAFRRGRRVVGAAEELVFLVQAVSAAGHGKDSLPAYGVGVVNLSTGEWRRAVPAPWGPVPLFAQCAAAGDGRHLVLLGGWDPATLNPAHDVRVLDLAAGAWRLGRPMPAARSFFGCAGDGRGRVYVAGGHDACKNALRTAAVYDVATNNWLDLPDMSEERDEPQLVSALGRVFAASGYATDSQGAFKKSAEWYGAAAAAWSNEGDIMPAASSEAACLASVSGKLWSIEGGKGGVREWEGSGNAWKEIADGPPGMKFCVKAVGVGDGDGLFVFGSLANAAEEGDYAAWVMDAGCSQWRRLTVPPGFGSFVYSAAAVQV